MTLLLALLPERFRLLAEVLLIAAIAAAVWGWIQYGKHAAHERGLAEGRAEIHAQWDKEKLEQDAADMAAAQEHAVESKRRMAKQQENQDAQNQELARARADADRSKRVAEQLRRDHETAAAQWRSRLADSPTRADIEAAAGAIGVCTDLLGRAVARAGILASYADTARAAGLKCERDYDALTPAAGGGQAQQEAAQ